MTFSKPDVDQTTADPINGRDVRIEVTPVYPGAGLLTVFRNDVPVLALLRDNLGEFDPEASRLRYVWILTSARPAFLQRMTASLPFFYWRTPTRKQVNSTPAALFDLGSPRKSVYRDLGTMAMQTSTLDPSGWMIRSSTRSYRGNSQDHRNMQVLESLAALSDLERRPEADRPLNNPELRDVQARLQLSTQLLGGLVRDSRLSEAYYKQREREQESRGHNWELLRQQAEVNGLYFQPLGAPGDATHAILWIAREDLVTKHPFDARFLKIADPRQDARLKHWKGYAERRPVDDQEVEMIPLALYSLDHPNVPLLMVDFRDYLKNKSGEMARRAIADAVYGIAGVSRYSNWPLLAGQMTWNFVSGRHGAAVDRSARFRSYAQMRYRLAFDSQLPPELRKDLQQRLEKLGLNPLEDNVSKQNQFAQAQYEALVQYARNPEGLPKRLDRDRRAELARLSHHGFKSAALLAASFLSLGLYTHRESAASGNLSALADARRVERHRQFLEAVAASKSISEVSWNADDIRRSLDALQAAELAGRSARVVAKVFFESSDDQLRLSCLRTLHRIGAQESRAELQKLSVDRRINEHWRSLARGYAETPSSVALDPLD